MLSFPIPFSFLVLPSMLALSYLMLALTLTMLALTFWIGKPESCKFAASEFRDDRYRHQPRGDGPDAVGGSQARRRLLDHRQPGATDPRPGRAGNPQPDRESDARARLCAEPRGRRVGKRQDQFGRRAGADHRQLDLCRHRAGPVRQARAARLFRDPGAIAL